MKMKYVLYTLAGICLGIYIWVGFDIHNRLPFAFVAQAVTLLLLVIVKLTKKPGE